MVCRTDWAASVYERVLGQPPADGAVLRSLRTTSDAVLIFGANRVIKVHEPGTDGDLLGRRLELAADPALAAVLLHPSRTRPVQVPGPDGPASPDGPLDGLRWASAWPRVSVLDPLRDGDPARVPWAEFGALLAALHSARPHRTAPPQGAVARLARAVDGLTAMPAARPDLAAAAARVRTAEAALPATARVPHTPGRPATVVHGDWHLGQTGRLADGTWRLLDVDDLGYGDPVWDFARPAGFWAAGLLDDDAWQRLTAAYRQAGGPALGPDDVVDAVARAAIVQAAAGAVRRCARNGVALDEVDEHLLATCDRMAADR